MLTIHARNALLPDGWAHNVRIAVLDGRISAISHGVEPEPADERHHVLVAGMPNLHSHAFQRGMAGLAEVRGPGNDSFWSWRDVMYRFALSMTPDQMQAIATWLYVEMLEAGFTRVGEFHYLHHRPDGGRYDDIAEMASRIAQAASATGIGLTLLPVLYAHAGFGGLAPKDEQRRFISGIDDYARLFERCETIVSGVSGANVGVAPHSLRAVTPGELGQIVDIAKDRPIHIHIAEQTAEVEDCIAHTGRRPIEWLLENQRVDGRWCLIHATHLTPDEVRGIARAGAVVGLCPVTEANLGDGIFPGREFFELGGSVGIGTDSNILVGVADELRQLEYSQRLERRQRNVLAHAGVSAGREVHDWTVVGGSQALQGPTGIAVGNPADFVSLAQKLDCPAAPDQWLDMWIFSGNVLVDCVWVGGTRLVSQGNHLKRNDLKESFLQAMRQILS